MRVRTFALITLLALAWAMLPAPDAEAWIITYQTPSGATDKDGEPVFVRATFSSTGSNLLTIDIFNLLVDPHSVGQNLSDLGFTLSSNQKTGTLQTSTASTFATFERSVNDHPGTYTPTGSMVAPLWKLENNVSGGLRLCDLCAGGDAPQHTIIGSPDGTNRYFSANDSIAKTGGPHNPFLAGDVRFTITIVGLTDLDYVDSVFFSFGTTEGDNVPGVCTQSCLPGRRVPEPASLLLLGAGLVGLAGYGLRKRHHTK